MALNPSKDTKDPVHTTRYGVLENEDFMTETLDQIYVKQKKYPKTIKAYKILSLKYSEKSDSFADQICAIKNEMENQ